MVTPTRAPPPTCSRAIWLARERAPPSELPPAARPGRSHARGTGGGPPRAGGTPSRARGEAGASGGRTHEKGGPPRREREARRAAREGRRPPQEPARPQIRQEAPLEEAPPHE